MDLEMRQRRREFYRMLADTVEYRPYYAELEDRLDYRKRIQNEGLVPRDQLYKNIMITVGDTWRYLPFVLAWTDTQSQITISRPELLPYGRPVLAHEKEHCVNPGIGEYMTDLNAEKADREHVRSSVRVKY